MPASELSHVFISYARKDGAALALRLQSDLTKQGFDTWLDTQRIKGGAMWTIDIEDALDDAEFVLALMTSGSYVSEICRAEQLRALRLHKCVIPLRAQSGADVPLHLEAKNYRDFTVDSRYTHAFTELLADLNARNGIALKPEFRETSYVTVPPQPVNFVERPEALTALRNALITDDGSRHISLTALQGMGGIGKTVLAQALSRDEVVQQAFPDGVVWITIGKESSVDTTTRMREVGKALGDDLSHYENALAAKHQYRSTIRKKAALIVVDDVWRSSDLEPLRAEDSPRSRLLFTTRDASIAAAMGAREHVADLLTADQSRQVLARWSRTETTNLPPIAAQLIHECGRLPLALSMVGAMLRGKPTAYWNAVAEHLRNADLDRIKAQFPGYPYTDVLCAIQVSVDSLDETSRARYVALAVLLEEMAAAPPVQQCLWGVDENQASETAEQFVSLSLAQRDQPEGSIRLHDLQLDFVRAQYQDKEALELIHGAVQLSSHVISRDPEQFASQMVGRLLPHENASSISEFIQQVCKGSHRRWLRPTRATLHPAGTPLIRTITGHLGPVFGVAISGNGQVAVSASHDQTLKVWDLRTGRELHTLPGRPHGIRGMIALSVDGQMAVSTSDYKMLKVWDVGSGRELRSFTGDISSVTGVALSGDGRLAVSGHSDGTVKVWEVESGRELRTLKGSPSKVDAVAVSGDGRLAVSGHSDGTVKVWEVESEREIHTLKGHSSFIASVALSRDGRRGVSGSGDDTLRMWDLERGQELCAFKGHSAWIAGVAISADGRGAVSASLDKTLGVWDLDSNREIGKLKGHDDRVLCVAVDSDFNCAISGSGDGTLKLWKLGFEPSVIRVLEDHQSAVNALVCTKVSRFVSGSSDGTLKVWDSKLGRDIRTLHGHSKAICSVGVSRDGRWAVSGSADKTIKVWDIESGHELQTLEGHLQSVTAVAVTLDGRWAVSASDDLTLRIWDLASGRELRRLVGPVDPVETSKLWRAHVANAALSVKRRDRYFNCLAMSEDGSRMVSAFFDRIMKVWDLREGRVLRMLEAHRDRVCSVALSPDGRLAISGSLDQSVGVWDVDNGREFRSLRGHTGVVNGVAVSRDVRLVASTSEDSTLKLWDLNSEEALATFSCDGALLCCAFVNDRELIAGDSGGHVHLLRLEQPKLKP